jgi:P-type conjugative transfer protein TrbJ
VLLFLLLLTIPQHAIGILGIGDIVHDPINLVQNAATALRTAQSNANEVILINNQARSLLNEAKQLTNLPLDLVNDIQGTIADYYGVLQQGQGLAYQAQSSLQQFEQLYNSGWGGNGGMMAKAQVLVAQVRNASRIATQAQAVYDRLCLQQSTVNKLMTASQASIGTLQASQAGNQLLGVLASQNASMQELVATQARLQVSVAMDQALRDEASQANMQQWLANWPTAPFRGPGQGQGPRLP